MYVQQDKTTTSYKTTSKMYVQQDKTTSNMYV